MKKKIMAPHDEISSAEKLLEEIRTRSAPPDKTRVKSPVVATNRAGHRAPLGGSLIPASKKITLGVDIGRSGVRLVKVARISNDRWKLLDCLTIPFEPGISRGDSRFHEFLRSSVSAIAGPDGKYDVWTLMSPENLDVRNIKIPKVSKAQIPNAVYWTVKRETNLSEKENIIDFEVRGDLLEKGIVKIGIMAYIIPGKDLDAMRDTFSRSGLMVRGITVAPFAIQNLFRSGCAPRHDKPVGVLNIGNEHSRIDVFSKGNLVLTRGMKAGIDSMVEAFAEKAYEEKWKVAKEAGEQFLTASENEADNGRGEAKALLLDVFSGSRSPDESIGSTGLREETVFEMIRPALGRLARQVERTFEYYSLTLGNEKADTIYVSCAAGHWERPFDFIADQLGIERKVLDPLDQGAIVSDEVIAPATIAERVPFTTAVGLALSDNVRTPNLIFTYRDKEELGKIARINRGIFCAFLAIILALTGVFFWQVRLTGQKEAEATQLQGELDRYNPQPNQNMIAALAAKAIAKRRALVERSSRVLGTAVIGELASLTPPNVQLLSVRADLGSKSDELDIKGASAGETKEPAKMKKEAKKALVLEGIVTGRRDAMEASLAGYLMKLSASPLFVHPVVSSNTFESYPDEGEVLRFSVQIGLP
jgi:Tfp pilus assembly PilM family ATPase